MLFDGMRYEDYATRSGDPRITRIRPILNLFEKKLGVDIIYSDRDGIDTPELREGASIATLLYERGIIRYVRPGTLFSDEPRFKSWIAASKDTQSLYSGGASAEDDKAALLAALAESVERHLWLSERDYFLKPVRASVEEMKRHGSFIPPERFAAFSAEDRAKNPRLQLKPDASYLWTQGTSLVNEKQIYIPAQIASRAVNPAEYPAEPLIRHQNTCGIATWPTRTGAQLGGALELIEREAYMVMWLNQLTVPKIPLSSFYESDTVLGRLLERCKRYRLKIHALSMPTDAPTHAICVIVEDESGQAPRFALGLKAHRSLSYTIEKALLEALRARRVYRMYFQNGGTWDPSTPVEQIGHAERLYYWGEPRNAQRLAFLVTGKEKDITAAPWEQDSIEEHLSRVTQWCQKNNFECVSVSMGHSGANPTPWQVEMVVMPDLQPTYLLERLRQFGATRRITLAQQLGYTPRKEPFAEGPHPYS
jgi:ribosomal protein S12 methylthiotransferase accessory factor